MLLLDTNIVIFLINEPNRITKKQIKAMESDNLAISLMTIWELSMLSYNKPQRLKLGVPLEQWLYDVLSTFNIQIIPLDFQICLESYNLPDKFHGDPCDRMIVATARCYDLELVTSDGKIQKYPHVKTIK